jgi:cytochrome c1
MEEEPAGDGDGRGGGMPVHADMAWLPAQLPAMSTAAHSRPVAPPKDSSLSAPPPHSALGG